MPIHGIAALLEGRVNYGYAVTAVILVILAATLKAWSGGRKNTWERDWAGKMILVIVSTDSSLLRHRHRQACTRICFVIRMLRYSDTC
jgi:hypothetical protein